MRIVHGMVIRGFSCRPSLPMNTVNVRVDCSTLSWKTEAPDGHSMALHNSALYQNKIKKNNNILGVQRIEIVLYWLANALFDVVHIYHRSYTLEYLLVVVRAVRADIHSCRQPMSMSSIVVIARPMPYTQKWHGVVLWFFALLLFFGLSVSNVDTMTHT